MRSSDHTCGARACRPTNDPVDGTAVDADSRHRSRRPGSSFPRDDGLTFGQVALALFGGAPHLLLSTAAFAVNQDAYL